MSNSLVEFKGVGFWVDDFPLEIWLYFLVQQIDAINLRSAWLNELQNEWLYESTHHLGGMHQVALDKYITTEERKDAILFVAETTINNVYQYGLTVSVAELKKHAVGGAGWSRANETIPLEPVVGTGRNFINLLRQVAVDPKRITGFVARVDIVAEAGEHEVDVTAHVLHGDVNCGSARIEDKSGHKYWVVVTLVSLHYNFALEQDEMNSTSSHIAIFRISGLLPSDINKDNLLIQDGVAGQKSDNDN